MSYTDQEILYAMFLIKANCNAWEFFFEVLSDDGLCRHAKNYYADLFADRAECEEEFEGYVFEHGWNNYGMVLVDKRKHEKHTHKIKFRFVGEE